MAEYQLKRLNENWSALPQALQDLFRKIYSCEVECGEKLRNRNNEVNDFAKGRISMLESLFGSHNLTAQADVKPKVPNHIADSSNMVDYAQYRLDLAKEVVLKLVETSDRDTNFISVFAKVAVAMADEIVKRLKETDNAD